MLQLLKTFNSNKIGIDLTSYIGYEDDTLYISPDTPYRYTVKNNVDFNIEAQRFLYLPPGKTKREIRSISNFSIILDKPLHIVTVNHNFVVYYISKKTNLVYILPFVSIDSEETYDAKCYGLLDGEYKKNATEIKKDIRQLYYYELTEQLLKGVNEDLIDIEHMLGRKITAISSFFTVKTDKNIEKSTLDLSILNLENCKYISTIVDFSDITNVGFISKGCKIHKIITPILNLSNVYRVGALFGNALDVNIIDFTNCIGDLENVKSRNSWFFLDIDSSCFALIVISSKCKLFKRYLIKQNDTIYLDKIAFADLETLCAKMILLGKKEHYLVGV